MTAAEIKAELRWRYITNGLRKHALRYGGVAALCGIWPSWFEKGEQWHDNRDVLDKLPECLACLRALGKLGLR